MLINFQDPMVLEEADSAKEKSKQAFEVNHVVNIVTFKKVHQKKGKDLQPKILIITRSRLIVKKPGGLGTEEYSEKITPGTQVENDLLHINTS